MEAQLCEIFGEVEKENLLLNTQHLVKTTRRSANGENDVEDAEENVSRPGGDRDEPPVMIDILGMDDDITPLQSSPEGTVHRKSFVNFMLIFLRVRSLGSCE